MQEIGHACDFKGIIQFIHLETHSLKRFEILGHKFSTCDQVPISFKMHIQQGRFHLL